jgi:hypothetical protein
MSDEAAMRQWLGENQPTTAFVTKMIGYPYAWRHGVPKSVTVDPWVYDLLENAIWPMLRLTNADLADKGYENVIFRGIAVIRGASE